MAEVNGPKLAKLRQLLEDNKIDAYVIPTADAHISEYVSTRDARRSFISEFTGSAGTAVVTKDAAYLWTDGRYFLQAEKQLPPGWTLMKQGLPETPTLQEQLIKTLPKGAVVGVDPFVLQVSAYLDYETTFEDNGLQFKSFLTNFVDEVWGADQPALANGAIKAHPMEYAGETMESKVEKVRQKMKANNCYAVVLCALDEIAWLLNLRGSDIEFNPVFLSYAVVTLDDLTFFVDEKKFDASVKLSQDVILKPYDAIIPYLKDLKKKLFANKENNTPHKAWVDASKSNYSLYYALDCPTKAEVKDFIITTANPTTLMKAIKNKDELEGMKQAHIRDGAAVSRFLSWFEEQYTTLPEDAKDEAGVEKQSTWNEYTLSNKLEEFRKKQDKFVQLSFDTISSVGPNGAIIHYKPDETKSSQVSQGNVYLLDSGGQYLDGTTDITRTFYIPSPTKPTPTDFQKDTFTRVLQGHIALANVKFPSGTPGPALDVLARQYLWDVNLSFLHGTGHGVGAYLNVHEGPCGIHMLSRQTPAVSTPLVDGMILSNEPGYYHDGEFGIRIENLVYVYKQDEAAAYTKKYGTWYGFKNLTYVPIDRQLIDVSLLSQEHKNYLNNYHKECFDLVAPLLEAQGDATALEWLKRNTAPM